MVSLASRASLCINPSVKALGGSGARINAACWVRGGGGGGGGGGGNVDDDANVDDSDVSFVSIM